MLLCMSCIKDHINILTSGLQFVIVVFEIGIQALLADWESGNKSRRMILSYDQRIMTGQYPVADLMGYRHTKDGRLVIEPEEAKTVRFIFLAFIQGYNYDQIAAVLTQKSAAPCAVGRSGTA